MSTAGESDQDLSGAAISGGFCLVPLIVCVVLPCHPSLDEYYPTWGLGSDGVNYGITDGEVTAANFFQLIKFTHIDTQPTESVLKRRLARELAGEQFPYDVLCRPGETPCHMGGRAWEVSRHVFQAVLREVNTRTCSVSTLRLTWNVSTKALPSLHSI